MKILVSVMIPAYRAERVVQRALASVPRELVEQVCIVSDGDPEGTYEHLDCEVIYLPENRGPTATFNACIEHATGELVHILHADDQASLAFYVSLDALTKAYPDCALYGSWYLYGYGPGQFGIPEHCPPQWLVPSHDASPLYYRNPVAASGVVLRREFAQGFAPSFEPELVHVADWLMWTRAIAIGGGVFNPAPLVTYHQSNEMHTSRLMRTGENVRDMMRMGRATRAAVDGFDPAEFRRLRVEQARAQAAQFREIGDEEAAKANEAVAAEVEAMG